MIWSPFGYWLPMTKREWKLARAKAQERSRERVAKREAARSREVERRAASWDRMRADIARRYANQEFGAQGRAE